MLSASTRAVSASVGYTGGWLQSRNTVTRNLEVDLGKYADIYNLVGRLRIATLSGQGDERISTLTESESGSIVSTGNAKAYTTITDDQTVTIRQGTKLHNAAGDLYLQTLTGANVSNRTLNDVDIALFVSQRSRL